MARRRRCRGAVAKCTRPDVLLHAQTRVTSSFSTQHCLFTMRTTARPLILGFFTALTIVTPTLGQSLPWTLVGETAQHLLFVDFMTLSKKGTVRQAWMLTSVTDPSTPGAPSLRTLRDFDCPGSRYRNLQVIRYDSVMGRGNITSIDKAATTWLPAIPGGAAENALQNVCKR